MALPAPSPRAGRLRWWVLLLACPGLGCAPMSGPGVDWSLDSQLTHRVETDINRDLDPDDQDLLLTNALDAGLILDAETKRALVRAELGAEARYFIGEDDDLAGTGDINPRGALRGTWQGKTTEISASVSAVVREADADEITDTGLSENSTRELDGRFSLELAEQIDTRNRISSGLDARAVDFIDGGTSLIETRTIGASFGWNHVLTQTTVLNTTLGLRHFRSDDAEGTRTQTASLSLGMAHQRTPRHSFQLSGGVTGLRTFERNRPGGTDLNVGFTGTAGMDYRTRSLNAGLGLTQSIEPSSIGDVQAFTRLIGTLGYTLNDTERLGLRMAFGRRGDVGGEGDNDTLITADVGPSYTWRLTDSTALSVGYAFRMSHDDDGTGLGHRVTAAFTKDFDFLP